MATLERLLSRSGSWRGTSILRDPHSGSDESCDSAATLAPLARGRFARFDYGWSYQGEPQEGSLLIGLDPQSGAAGIHWIDSWHMGHTVMHLTGRATQSGGVDAVGSYSVPDWPDWGWRITVVPDGDDALSLRMFNITPEGQEDLAVEARYERS